MLNYNLFLMRIVIEAFMYTVNMLNYNLFLMRIVIYDIVLECHRSIHDIQ